MYVKKNFSVGSVLAFTGIHILYLTLWATAITLLFEFTQFDWLRIPWLPLSVIGTAVAFYVGFKNNSSYDRLWEARKIWGAIVNSSRMWGASVRHFVGTTFASAPFSRLEVYRVHQRLIHRHIAWLYALRSQLLVPTSWEHMGTQSETYRRYIEYRKKQFGMGLYADEITEVELTRFLPPQEVKSLIDFRNTATQIVDRQAEELKALRDAELIDDFRHMALQDLLNDLYTHQGKCERIKKFPFPRQYASTGLYFVFIFCALLPFGMVPAFQDIGPYSVWLAIPFTVIVGWVYITMELVGDYSENPFEGLGNDIPMLSLCRVIEIDLLEMLREEEIPGPIEPVNHVLM